MLSNMFVNNGCGPTQLLDNVWQPQLKPCVNMWVCILYILCHRFSHLLKSWGAHGGAIGAIHHRHQCEHVTPQVALFQGLVASVAVCSTGGVPICVPIEIATIAKVMAHAHVVKALVTSEVVKRPRERVWHGGTDRCTGQ